MFRGVIFIHGCRQLTEADFDCVQLPNFCRVVPWMFLLGAKDAWPNENKQNFRGEKQSHHDKQSKRPQHFLENLQSAKRNHHQKQNF